MITPNFNVALLLAFISLVCVLPHAVFANSDTHQPCMHDPARSLADLKTEGASDPQFFYLKMVPKDFEIVSHPVYYVITKPTEDRNLPTADFGGSIRFSPPYRGFAVCRVRDPNGMWWYASRLKDGGLFYVNEADARPE
jgi:hypothetical protein